LFNTLSLLFPKAFKLSNEPASDRRGYAAPRKVTAATVFWVLLAVVIIALGAWQQRAQVEQQARQVAINDQQAPAIRSDSSNAPDPSNVAAEASRSQGSQSNSSPSVTRSKTSTKNETTVDRGSSNRQAISDTEKSDRSTNRSPANSATAAEGKNGRYEPPNKSPQPAKLPAADPQRVIVQGMKIKDLDGRIVYEGPIDLTETLERIAAEERLRFRNDGSVFGNRERRLPSKQAGYYREWVHPTPELDGPGPQRVVTGEKGEIYYTHDHYRTFKKLK
jgi:ribonuclease T1